MNAGDIIALVAVLLIGAGMIVAAFKHTERKRSRIYERLDECKADFMETNEKTYSKKEICEIKHSQIEKELKEIKEKTDLIPDIAAQLRILVNGRKA